MNSEILTALRQNKEIELSVTGRISGKVTSRPVWFVTSDEGRSIFLIPVFGRKTQWYRNVNKTPSVTIRVGGQVIEGKIAEVESEMFKDVLASFIRRYGEADMKSYYPRLEVALEFPLP